MPEHIAKEDIYNRNGILLLSKGKKTTNETITRLKRLGSYKLEEPFELDAKQNVIVQEFGERMDIHNEHIIEYPNKILSSVIFESRTKPWWIYVNALSNYVDWLYTHSIDVAIISLMIAVELRYSDEELWNIGLGAFLHDVGKLLVPRSIIQKPGPLDDMEMVYMRQHCELGMSSLESFCLPKECTDIILQHHERLDGSGYPKGLKEDEICLNAKIAMIADVVDAITSYRPYKSIQEVNTAIKILRNDKGKYSNELISVLEKILE
jgi:putative nucleotidyltransferase with HDIG domain